MASQQSPKWFGIAQKVDGLLSLPSAKERFRERVKEAAAEWRRRFDAKREREEARSKAVKRTGVPYRVRAEALVRIPAPGTKIVRPGGKRRVAPARRAKRPKDGSFHWLEDFHDGDPPMEAWLPAELSPDLDPDDSPPLPVPSKREVSLAERYAVLAAVWDAHWGATRRSTSGLMTTSAKKASITGSWSVRSTRG